MIKKRHSIELSVCEGLYLFQQVLGQHDNDYVYTKIGETIIFFTV